MEIITHTLGTAFGVLIVFGIKRLLDKYGPTDSEFNEQSKIIQRPFKAFTKSSKRKPKINDDSKAWMNEHNRSI